MKKLLFIAAIVCAAAANAATINWGMGTQIKADGSANAANGTLSAYVWLVDKDTYDGMALGSIWDTYGSAQKSDMASTANLKNESFGGGYTAGSIKQENVANGTTEYGIIIIGYDSDKDGTIERYAVNKAIGEVNEIGGVTSPSNLGKTISGTSTAVTWADVPSSTPSTDVPEPTSGLLLVLGGAMLALRRRR